jgi:DsbC/DsbD-like thiol-disulfide interchange protein
MRTYTPVALALLAFPGSAAADPPRFEARIASTLASMEPGARGEVAVELELEEGWSAFHPLVLDTGVPLQIDLRGSEGLLLGPLRSPAPKIRTGPEGSAAILRTPAVFTAEIEVGESPSVPAFVRVGVSGVACKETCTAVETGGELRLAGGGESATVAGQLLESARGRLPATLSRAAHIEGSTIRFEGEGPGEVVLDIRVEDGHYIQGSNPGHRFLIPSQVYVESVDDFGVGEPRWPVAETKATEHFGEVRELRGRFEIHVPVTRRPTGCGEVPVTFLFRYQACADVGTCHPPRMTQDVVSVGGESCEVPPRKPDG